MKALIARPAKYFLCPKISTLSFCICQWSKTYLQYLSSMYRKLVGSSTNQAEQAFLSSLVFICKLEIDSVKQNNSNQSTNCKPQLTKLKEELLQNKCQTVWWSSSYLKFHSLCSSTVSSVLLALQFCSLCTSTHFALLLCSSPPSSILLTLQFYMLCSSVIQSLAYYVVLHALVFPLLAECC